MHFMFFIPILFFLLLPAPFPRADLAYSIAHFGLVCKTGILKNLTVKPGFPIKLPCKSISICRALLFAFFSGLTSGLVCGAVIGVRCPIRHIVHHIFCAVYHVVHTVHDAVAHVFHWRLLRRLRRRLRCCHCSWCRSYWLHYWLFRCFRCSACWFRRCCRNCHRRLRPRTSTSATVLLCIF